MTEKAPLRALIADDSPTNRLVLQLLLDNLGLATDLAENGKQAVEIAHSDKYDVILMDIQMPEMDGFDAAFEIRKQNFGSDRHTPIIAVTALDKDMVKERAIRSGIDDYLSKPIDREVLKSKIQRWSKSGMPAVV